MMRSLKVQKPSEIFCIRSNYKQNVPTAPLKNVVELTKSRLYPVDRRTSLRDGTECLLSN
jgi:hypothetical protein